MQIYVLRAKPELLTPDVADSVGYSEWTEPRGFVVLANSEGEARLVASRQEYSGEWWLNPDLTTCELVDPGGEPRAIMADEPTG